MPDTTSDETVSAAVTVLTAAGRQRSAHVDRLLFLDSAVQRHLEPHQHRSHGAVLEAVTVATKHTASSNLCDRWTQLIGDLRIFEITAAVIATEIAATTSRPQLVEHLRLLNSLGRRRSDCLRRMATVMDDCSEHLSPHLCREVHGALALVRKAESRAKVMRGELEELLLPPLSGAA